MNRTHARLWARPRSGETRVVVADGNGRGEARTDESARPLPAWKSWYASAPSRWMRLRL